MTEFVNLTPHRVVLVRETVPSTVPELKPEDIVRVFEPSGTVARLRVERQPLKVVENVPIVKMTRGALEPDVPRKPDTYYLVSAPVCDAVKREDFLAPDTSPEGVVRNPAGQVLGVKALVSCK